MSPVKTVKPACSLPPCSHSIGRRLSFRLALFTMAVLSALFTFTWFSVGMMIKERNDLDLQQRCQLLADVLTHEARSGSEAAVVQRLQTDAPMRSHSRVEVWRADGSLLYAAATPGLQPSAHQRVHEFVLPAPELAGGSLKTRYTVDFSRDAAIGHRWAWLLVGMTLAAGAVVSIGARWQVRQQLRPVNLLAAQTRAISPGQLDQRLTLVDPAEELQPWVTQFNALMERLQRAYVQLESFNADVAHELRTPLATLIGQTEVALSRERSSEELCGKLASNLEEMQRLAALVNDMLFLSQADRGATARRGQPVSLAELAAQVVDFHEATLEDAGLRLEIDGDARVAVDEPLVKRALSNLLGNATRFAEQGSTLRVSITRELLADPAGAAAPALAGNPLAAEEVRLAVQNLGRPIEPEHLPRLFDRFFRADASRVCPNDIQHHGLGLAIVAAIARMHGGRTWADSGNGTTQVGFTVAAG